MEKHDLCSGRILKIQQQLDHIATLIENAPYQRDHIQSDYLSAKEAAAYLKVPIGTLYNLVHRKEIPNYKRGKRLYFDCNDLKKIIESGRRKTKEELKEYAIEQLSN